MCVVHPCAILQIVLNVPGESRKLPGTRFLRTVCFVCVQECRSENRTYEVHFAELFQVKSE